MKRRLLLVDDDRAFRSAVAPLLESLDLAVVEAASLAEASARRAEGIDLAIVDGLLPDGDGITWIRKLREKEDRLPLIFVSAFWRDAKSYRRLTSELGVLLVLHKPVILEAFRPQIRAVLERLSPRAAAPAEEELDIEVDLGELRAGYAAELPARAGMLLEAVASLRQRYEPKVASDALALAHRLHGTAGTYGFSEASRLAGRVEAALANLGGPLANARGDALTTALTAARELEQLFPSAPRSVAPAPSGAPRPSSPGTRAPPDTEERVAPPRVLLVDDDPRFVERASALLRAGGMETRALVDPAALLEVLQQERPDVVLLEAVLPGFSGIDLCRVIRNDPALAEVGLVVVSARSGADVRLAAYRAGADDHIAKPIVPEELVARVRARAELQALRRRSSRS